MNSEKSEKKEQAEISAYLYDTDGSDRIVDFSADDLANLNDRQILWIDISQRDEEVVERACSALQLKNIPIKSVLSISERPKLEVFKDFYRIFIYSVRVDEKEVLHQIPIDFLVGNNFVITIHDDGEIEYFQEFKECERDETHIGRLDADSFTASLLDLHIVSYFRALEEIERRVDKMDSKILKRDLKDEEFLEEMVSLRRDVSKLRRWFLPHRDVFYALARPDFGQNVNSDSSDNFQHLNQHFETAVDSIESSRDMVLSLFDLYATKTAHRMNDVIKRLTFITLLVGGLGAIAGIWGMNFEVEYFKSGETGFWLTIGAMGLLAVILTIAAKFTRWI